ncbi:M20/M25/M40 family metallo-hydrolase [Schaalia odontolytica]|uniref:Acetylornithine deacetylase n=1 Tax=Schaalia odontolytica TaxID=1660 RepID=A0A0V8RSY1_9ACTO|nr:acetylornithine deacetylase [Schaalia odontolytica]QCT35243.1 M20/M25/M40 family metallo-hydrolase [Schaalia odontolytica]
MNVSAWGYRGVRRGSRDEAPAGKGIIVRTQSLGEQTVDLLGRLVRLGCVNDLTADSGGEERAADLLEDFFAGLPVSIERITPHPGRTTLVVTVEGADPRSPGTPLTLLGHTDVVPVDTAKWTRDPFGAQVEDDVMWGRGTVDMLHLTAAMAVVTREVARRAQDGNPPARSLVFVAAADEEARGGLGVPWIGDNKPDVFPWDAALSEMGGAHIRGRRGGDSVVVVVGEKGAAQRRLHIRGDAGHGSVPLGRTSAVERLAQVSAALSAARWLTATDVVWASFVRAFEFDETTETSLINGTYEGDYSEFEDLAAFAHAISHVTVAQTVARAGGPINVMPSHATLELDIRTLPGVDDDDVDAAITAALGDLAEHVTIERLLCEAATASSIDTDLYRAIEAALTKRYPGARVVPVLFPGGSDLRVARRLGGIGYGFGAVDSGASLGHVYSQLHAHDEHIALVDVRATAEVLHEVVTAYLGA